MSATTTSLLMTATTAAMNPYATPAIAPVNCTLATCPLSEAHVDYVPTLFGNALYAAIFAIFLVPQVWFGIKFKTWGFMAGLLGGLLLEIMGYIGRVQMHSNPFIKGPFLMYLICLTIGPAFLSASIYLCLSRLVVVYGQHLSRFRPFTYTATFMGCDFISLLLQAAGGAIASTANTPSSNQMGINIMIAGLSFQVFSLCVFFALTAEFAWRVAHRQSACEPAFDGLRQTRLFLAFQVGLCVAALAIFVRSVFRVAELSQGFHGVLANQEVTFMILEGAMIVIATGCLTALHPGISFQGDWVNAAYTIRGGSARNLDAKDTASLDLGGSDSGRIA